MPDGSKKKNKKKKKQKKKKKKKTAFYRLVKIVRPARSG